MTYYQFFPLGEQALVISFGSDINKETNDLVYQVYTFLKQQRAPWIIDLVPAYATLAVHFDALQLLHHHNTPYAFVKTYIEEQLSQVSSMENAQQPHPIITIPVCYGGEFGPDLGHVATINDFSEEAVISTHSSPLYHVYMIGFSPGFPYLGGMHTDIATPRRDTPRTSVPAGSVGIAGQQTGVYPTESPGGWQIIGRTPLKLFQPESKTPIRLSMGDRIRFYPISASEFAQWEENKA
ncbi:kinase A inhibitor [Pullulanibacillus camelliae]|uniref:Kinase A inhibitor n=1 Tax=Pullulanibacillus camelliae TaxID=1707096 RepID=A0A8J3DZZ1_9BACL|nr:5-oxoprolinase subunit PxpB [Pullulanibacillus camelliae]GGE49624.1 kinase A inhibitor [Pullulanibacillus camelliae]